jgi:hypothetical protein
MTAVVRRVRFYEVAADFQGPVDWLVLINGASLQDNGWTLSASPTWPDGYAVLPRHPFRFPHYLETPRFRFNLRPGKLMRDIKGAEIFWCISRRMKDLIERIDPSSCEFRQCNTEATSGEPGPEYWLCSVTRLIFGRDLIDSEATENLTLRPKDAGLFHYHLPRGSKFRFKANAIDPSHHLFRVVEMAGPIYCDQLFKDSCKEAGLKGLKFDLIAEI